MTLELDLGNSYLKWRYGGLRGRLENRSIDHDELKRVWGNLSPDAVILAAVGQRHVLDQIITFVEQQWQRPVWQATTRAQCMGLSNSYQAPERMGVDRWLAMLGAFARVGDACCVVDCGSAITVDYIAADGRHLGGYIMPGLRLMRAGLLGNTEQIRVEFDIEPDTAPGNSTEAAVQHGLLLMFAALAERVVRDCSARLGSGAKLLVAGGDAALFCRWAPEADLVGDLVLDGLRLAKLAEGTECAG